MNCNSNEENMKSFNFMVGAGNGYYFPFSSSSSSDEDQEFFNLLSALPPVVQSSYSQQYPPSRKKPSLRNQLLENGGEEQEDFLLLAPTPIDPRRICSVKEVPLIPTDSWLCRWGADDSVQEAIKDVFLSKSIPPFYGEAPASSHNHKEDEQEDAAGRISGSFEEADSLSPEKNIMSCSITPAAHPSAIFGTTSQHDLLPPTKQQHEGDDVAVDQEHQKNKRAQQDHQQDEGVTRKKKSDLWSRKFEQLVRFKQIHGHCLVTCAGGATTGIAGAGSNRISSSSKSFSMSSLEEPSDEDADEEEPSSVDGDEDINSLAQWVKRQRYQYHLRESGAHSTLTDERKRALDALGFVWQSHEARWEDRFRELMEFRSQHGHCNVPKGYETNKQLAIWVKCQRRQYKLLAAGLARRGAGGRRDGGEVDEGGSSRYKKKRQITLTPSRIERLQQVGFCWGRVGNAAGTSGRTY